MVKRRRERDRSRRILEDERMKPTCINHLCQARCVVPVPGTLPIRKVILLEEFRLADARHTQI